MHLWLYEQFDKKDSNWAKIVTGLLTTAAGTGTVCLVAVHPGRLAAFRDRVLRLAAEGVVSRVEAEPQL